METMKTGAGMCVLAATLYGSFGWGYNNGYANGIIEGKKEAYQKAEKIMTEMSRQSITGIEEVISSAYQKARADLKKETGDTKPENKDNKN